MKTNYYDSIASGYDELHLDEQIKKLKIIEGLIDIKLETRLLDVGCGEGDFLRHIAKKDPSAKLSGIDIAFNEHNRINFMKGDFQETQIEGKFNVICAMAVPEHMERPLLFAQKLDELDKQYLVALGECRTRKLITAGHSAYGHLAERYGLEQISLYGLSPDSEPTPKQLAGVSRTVNGT